MDPKLITPFVLAAVFAWLIYRRVRRNFGRQALKPGRMQVRIGLFAFIGVIMLGFSMRDFELAGALLGGIAVGCVLGYFGLQGTKFERTAEGQFYTPHTAIGLFVTVLFLGRLVYRFVLLYPQMQAAAAAHTNQDPWETYRSPLTLAIFGVLIGYYILFYAGVLRKGASLPVTPGASETV